MRDGQRDEVGWAGTLVRIAALIMAMVAGFVIEPWLGVAATVIGLALLVRWHARAFACRCPHCGHVFMIPAWLDLASPHGVRRHDGRWAGWKLLRCPRWSWVEAVPRPVARQRATGTPVEPRRQAVRSRDFQPRTSKPTATNVMPKRIA